MRTSMTRLLTSGAFGGMTVNERRLGRFIRDGEGHPPAAPAADPQPIADPVVTEAAPLPAGKTVDELYEEEFGGTVDPATPAAEGGSEGETPPSPDTEAEGGSVQERIDELTANRREAERQLAEEQRARKAEREEFEARLAALEGKKPEKPAETKERGPDDAPNPEDYEFGEADSRFIADHARYHARQEFLQQESLKTRQQELQRIEDTWTEAVAEPAFAEQYPDFDEVVTKGAEEKKWACSPIMALLVKSSPVGPDVAYHLASNAAESRRIAALDDAEQLLEIGRLEGRYLAKKESNVKPVAPSPKKVTEAPTPPAQRSRGSGGQFQDEQSATYDRMLREFN